VAVVCAPIIKRKMLLKIIENISEVDNKIRCTLQEETFTNRNVLFIIFSEITLLSVINCPAIIYKIYQIASEPYYIIVIDIIGYVPDICNALILFQFVNIVYMMKQRYDHLNKRLTNWINGAVIRPMFLNKENETRSQSNRAVDNVIVTPLCVSIVEDFEGTTRQNDIHLLRQIYSEMYDITCLINDTYDTPFLLLCVGYQQVLCLVCMQC